jgi:hypothetical protein
MLTNTDYFDDEPADGVDPSDPDPGEALEVNVDAAPPSPSPSQRLRYLWPSSGSGIDVIVGSNNGGMAAVFTALAVKNYLDDRLAGDGTRPDSFRHRTGIAEHQFDIDVVALLTPPADDRSASGAEAWETVTRDLVRLLKHWNRAAGSPRPSIRIEEEFAARVATGAVRAAYAARDVVVERGPAAAHDTVANFVTTWLGLRPTTAMVRAATDALLQTPLTLTVVEPDEDLIRRLRIATLGHRRALRWIGHTQMRGQLIDSLNREISIGAEAFTVADTVGIEDVRPSDAEGWNDRRIPRILRRLKPDEERVAMAYVHDPTVTSWTVAARICGLPDSYGERVRCKLKRLGQQLINMIASSESVPSEA